MERVKHGCTNFATCIQMIDFIIEAIRQGFLRHGDVLVMDNCPTHKEVENELRGFLDIAGIWLLFLPKYCPELNPIEPLWSKLK